MTWHAVNGPVVVIAIMLILVLIVVLHEVWQSIRSEWRKMRR